MNDAASNGLLVVGPNVEIVPISNFSDDVREKIGGAPTDWILSKLRSRSSSRRIDQETAAFLRLFCTYNSKTYH